MSATPPGADFRKVIQKALKTLNVEKCAQHSRIDHHTPGLNYLNLQRSDKFTLKLYLIEKAINSNAGYLVMPHSHRYEFNTTVMAGKVTNWVFNEELNDPALDWMFKSGNSQLANGYDRYEYSAELGAFGEPVSCKLTVSSKGGFYETGESYYLKTDQIHTLQTVNEPTLLCLQQFADIVPSNAIYLPRGTTLPASTGRVPSLEEAEAMRIRCLELMS